MENFDLEQAEIELKNINDLLCIFQEFFDNECPEENARGNDAKLAGQIFAIRAHQYRSLIYAAQDKIITMRIEIEAAIEKACAKCKKGGAVA